MQPRPGPAPSPASPEPTWECFLFIDKNSKYSRENPPELEDFADRKDVVTFGKRMAGKGEKCKEGAEDVPPTPPPTSKPAAA